MIDRKATQGGRLRLLAARPLARVGLALHRLGVSADAVTLAGFALTLLAALFIARGRLQEGGLLLLISLPLDALDGAVARAAQRDSRFGGVLDSTLDRYADAAMFAALVYYFASLGQMEHLALALLALVGSYGVSYVRARAGEAGIELREGLFTRLERALVLLLALLIPGLLLPGLWLLALGCNLTALQRLWLVYRQEP
ncbi:MAG: CDP-alcohol phosphatidyltransferase family protein [Anaerolineaceae bacterium]|nr:CDP-alcohol phosphatidyltransferase family protein [Anaerolineaceae bacterium]